MMPAARLTLISRYSPFGSIPSSPAEVPTTASYMELSRNSSASTNSRMPSGTMQKLVRRVTFCMELTSSECMAFVFFASLVSLEA